MVEQASPLEIEMFQRMTPYMRRRALNVISPFTLQKQIRFVVLRFYNPSDWLDEFREQNESQFVLYDQNITDANCGGRFSPLPFSTPLYAQVFAIDGKVSQRDCREFFEYKEAILAGPHALSILWKLARAIFSDNKWLASFGSIDSPACFLKQMTDEKYSFDQSDLRGDDLDGVHHSLLCISSTIDSALPAVTYMF